MRPEVEIRFCLGFRNASVIVQIIRNKLSELVIIFFLNAVPTT